MSLEASWTSRNAQFRFIYSAITDVITNLFLDIHPSTAKVTLFLDGNCFLIGFTTSEYSLGQMLLRVVADKRTSLLHNAL
jgi:hypothetical protein